MIISKMILMPRVRARLFQAALGLIMIAGLTGPAAAEFLLLTRTVTPNGAPADEIMGWPSVSSFLAGGEPVNRYGMRPGSSEVSLRFITTDPGGELLTMQAANGTDGTYDVHRWRDPYRFAANEGGSFVITRYSIGKLVAVTGDGSGRIFVVEETAASGATRTYRVKRWDSAASFASYDKPVTVGERSGMPVLSGLEFINGQLVGVCPATVGGVAGCAVRRWTDFSGFLAGPGEVAGSRAFAGEIVELFSSRQTASPAQATTARYPLWPWLGNKMPAAAPGLPGGFSLVDAFPGLTFQNPVKMLPRPGKPGEQWVAGREGFIWAVNGPGSAAKTTMLDLSAVTLGWGDSGLLGFAFHPEFGQAGSANRGHVFVAYNFIPAGADTSSGKSCNRLSRFTLADGAGNISRSSELILINQYDRHAWHNQGDLFFGADGFLYLSLGDEGGLDNTYGNAQKLNGGLFSGVLRLDVDQNPARSHPIRRQPRAATAAPAGWPATMSQGYNIPNDNPWQDPAGGVLEEFWAIGLRNPYRMSRDAVTGQVFIGDVGQSGEEEINVLAKGANYQWAFKEGLLTGPTAAPAVLTGTSTLPYWRYPHQDGNRCVIGGHVYRGSALAAELAGQYVFGDFMSGRVWAMHWQERDAPEVRQIASTAGFSLSGFGLDHDNEIYVMSLGYNGRILKLTQEAAPQPPATLSATGAFADLETLTPARGVLPFAVNAPLWSDQAVKQRWIALPGRTAPYSAGERVTFRTDAEWDYPAGTVLIKHFDLPTHDGDPALRRRLETRFMVKARDGAWYGVTYKWRADGSDADLLLDGLSETIAVTTASGGTRQQTWSYPSRSDCLQCHNTASTQVLGLRTWQLNGLLHYPGDGAPVNQLVKWGELGLFDIAPTAAQVAGMLRAAPLEDDSASLETRARSYIDANCAQCHRPGGAQARFDARFNVPLSQQGLVDAAPENNLGIANARLVAPGAVERSLLHLRMSLTGQHQMPPLGRHFVDGPAAETVKRWIQNLAPPAPPATVQAGVADHGVVALHWTPASSNADGFRIRRRSEAGQWTLLSPAAAATTSAHDLTIAPSTTYHYQIAAFNGAGDSPWTAAAPVTTWAPAGSWLDWQRDHPLGGLNAPLDNPDGDSAANLIEFALGADPASGGSAQDRFQVRQNPLTGAFEAQVTRPRGLTGAGMSLKVATDLQTADPWVDAGITPALTIHSDGTETLTFAALDSLLQLAGTARGFARLEVILTATGETASSAVWFFEQRVFPAGARSFGPAMLRPERFSGRVTEGSALLDVAASAGALSVRGRLSADRPAFVEVMDGEWEGHRFTVDYAGTTAQAIALAAGSPWSTLPVPPDLSGARIVLREHWTLDSLYPPGRWLASRDPVTSDRVQFYDGSSNSWTGYWLASLQNGPTWVKQGSASLQSQGGRVIPPGTGMLVQKHGADFVVGYCGPVRVNAFVLAAQGNSLLAGGWPLSQSPAGRSMLQGFAGAANPVLADRFSIWRQDMETTASAGYLGWFLLDAGTPEKRYWTRQGSARLLNDNLTTLFEAQRAFFLQSRTPLANWRMPLPWQP